MCSKTIFNGEMELKLTLSEFFDEQQAMEALVWGLLEVKKQAEERCKEDQHSLVAMSAYGILKKIKALYPNEYKIVLEEYNEIY